ncbi:Methionyl-tRNA synthetase [Ceratobasidium theobromae]|uniref:methionine--tRNA ligase n=1 Tax=Ceratobasidium theobromae TaxID=1582974 RepID=A0A5N5QS90_9AGAM|nr:Methionyl-tRNA synthetase [Ceratobasidium theobromae]
MRNPFCFIRVTFPAPLSTKASVTTGWTLKPYFVTTPIFYPNADPHIGHLYSMVLADILARYSRLRHPLRQVAFSTGTDEHGLKIQQAAKENYLSPPELCTGLLCRHQLYEVHPNNGQGPYFSSQAILVDRGYIYKGTHSGWYSVSDECFYPESQVTKFKDPQTGERYMAQISKETGQRVEWSEEENYKFKLSSFRRPLITIRPEPYYHFVLNSLINDESATQDLSVSRPRSRLEWGIQVPGDSEHTIYVWLDALVNYLTVAGYPDNTTAWPADVSVIGKDIIRFHTIYWPAFLFALDLPAPTTLLTHGHWTRDRQKMSKSRGNVTNPFTAMGHNSDGTPKQRLAAPGMQQGEIDVGVDGVRWYMLRAGGTFDTDSDMSRIDWSSNQVRKHYQRELAGSLGNLLFRITAPRLVARLPPVDLTLRPSVIFNEVHSDDASINQSLKQLPSIVDRYMENFQIGRVLEAVVDCLNEANRHITQLEPWRHDSNTEVVMRAHKYSAEALRIIGIILQPFIPSKADQLLTQLGVSYDDRGWQDTALWKGDPSIGRMAPGAQQLFPRLKSIV